MRVKHNEWIDEADMMVRQLNEGTGSVVERHGLCLSGIGHHADFISMRTMHSWLCGAVAMMDWGMYVKSKGTNT